MHLTNKTKQLVAVLSSTVFLCVYIFSTNPQKLAAPLLLIPPIAVFVVCLLLLRFVFGFFTSVSNINLKVITFAFSALPALLMMLAAMGQLGLRDVVLTILFITGLAWYFERKKQQDTVMQ
jgi:hypothetical protein